MKYNPYCITDCSLKTYTSLLSVIRKEDSMCDDEMESSTFGDTGDQRASAGTVDGSA